MKFKYRRYYLYYLARVFASFFTIIPLQAGLYLAGKMGALVYLALPKYRKIAIANLTLVFGKEKSPSEIATIARKVFENIGKNAFEMINFPKLNAGNISGKVDFKNRDIVDRAFAAGKGVLILTAHFGNWELLATGLRLYNYPGITIGRRIYFDKYDKWLNQLRKIHDVDVAYRDESPMKILRALKKNMIVGIVADQDVDSVDGVFVDFFGNSAYTPIGPVALAKATGAKLVPTFIIRSGDHHTITFEEPVELVNTGDDKKDLIENTQKWSRVFEKYIKLYPEQWVWMHRRWKTRPAQIIGIRTEIFSK